MGVSVAGALLPFCCFTAVPSAYSQASAKTVAHNWVLHEETRNTNSYWEIESPDPTDGSEILYASTLHLRHVNTGKYLALRRRRRRPSVVGQTATGGATPHAKRKSRKHLRSQVGALTVLTRMLRAKSRRPAGAASTPAMQNFSQTHQLSLDIDGLADGVVDDEVDEPAKSPPPGGLETFQKPLFLRQASKRAQRPSSPVNYELYGRKAKWRGVFPSTSDMGLCFSFCG